MATTYDEALPKAAMEIVADKLHRAVLGRRIDFALLHTLDQVLYDAVVEVHRKGHNIPPLVAILLERFGWIDIVRADLEHDGIQRVIQGIIRRFPDVDGVELALAIRRAFPTYRPDDAMGEHARVSNIIGPR